MDLPLNPKPIKDNLRKLNFSSNYPSNKSSTFQQGIKSRWKDLTGALSSSQQAAGYSGKVLDKDHHRQGKKGSGIRRIRFFRKEVSTMQDDIANLIASKNRKAVKKMAAQTSAGIFKGI
ncbi:hypothetical protein HZA71_01895 [Candidatus Falkowbacteria bacterium]|nr:hypothetical protein [Candidatus Falkowbacteria bacterium]